MSSEFWRTPNEIIFAAQQIYGQFAHDAAASDGAEICQSHWSEGALEKDWSTVDGLIWLNPPWCRGKPIRPWIQKARDSGARVVALLPLDTSTRAFHDLILPRVGKYYCNPHNGLYDLPGVVFLPRRVRYIDGHTGIQNQSAKFASAFVYFCPEKSLQIEAASFGITTIAHASESIS